MKLLSLLLALLALGACTKPNKAKCCLTQDECNAIGIDEPRGCEPGLACVDSNCVVPSCSMEGCAATAPICDTATDLCVGCDDSSDCARFPDQDLCNTATGSCVECVTADECLATEPVCDANTCRGCKLDSECPSRACASDGSCVSESAIVYLDPNGVDAGTCPRSMPCRTLRFGATRTTDSRNHLVMGPGTYQDSQISITSAETSALTILIHGGGATLTNPTNEGLISLGLPATIQDLVVDTVGPAISSYRPLKIERVIMRASNTAISTGSMLDVRDVQIENGNLGLELFSGASVMLDRATIHGGLRGISHENPTGSINVVLSNLLVYGTSQQALNLPATSGSASFVTIADSGASTPSGPRAVVCSSLLTIRSSIIWDPGSTAARPPIGGGCGLSSTIAGIAPVPGATSIDPVFVGAPARNYHLAPNSPARDMVDTGPALDFEGDARPEGARFDIGADETR